MNVLVLGNGFDLWHKLPTTYLCFLASTEYLVNKKIIKKTDIITIGTVFNAVKDNCSAIKNSCEAYSSVYNSFSLDSNKIMDLTSQCENNPWWHYFCKSLKKELGWIDFEQEIALVIDRMNIFLDLYCNPDREIDFNQSKADIATVFSDFFEPTTHIKSSSGYIGKYNFYYRYKDEYIQKQGNANKASVNRGKIADTLFDELKEFSRILDLYFQLFVDDTFEALLKKDLLYKKNVYSQFGTVITFNYTHSCEKIYGNKEVAHIHGSIGSSLVLGINSNQDDVADGDLTYIGFKKYYQRVLFETDLSYLSILQKMRKQYNQNQKVSVSIVGHSLNDTDKDSLKELFDVSNEIRVYYHDSSKIADFTKNLIHHFGKIKFDELRYNRNLKFLPLESISFPQSEVKVFQRPF